MTPGQEFVKTWKIKNTGICTWDTGYKAIFSYSSPPNQNHGRPTHSVGRPCCPGAGSGSFRPIQSPTTPGEYTGYWQMVNAQGIPFGTKDFILIVRLSSNNRQLKQAIKKKRASWDSSWLALLLVSRQHITTIFEWLDNKHHATMDYLASDRSRIRRADPKQILPECKSILVLAFLTSYTPNLKMQI
jgi:hypothetical protein